MLNKGRESAERATESARQAKQRMESELARMQRLVAELEHAKRCALVVFLGRHWSMLHAAALLRCTCSCLSSVGPFQLNLAVSQAMETHKLQKSNADTLQSIVCFLP